MSRTHVVMFSGGIGSAETARRVAERHGTDNLVMLCADTNSESDDWMMCIREWHNHIGGELVILANGGRTIWDVFIEERFLGNTRVDVCSKVLKRQPTRRWLAEHCDPATTTIYLGFDWTEVHRLDRARPRWDPWVVEAPLCDPPLVDKPDLIHEFQARGWPTPQLYDLGFPHANCGGGCVKAGQAQWKLLLDMDRERFLECETQEERVRQAIGKDVSILRDRRGGTVKPMTLRSFRHRVEGTPESFDHDDWGSCGCFTGVAQP